LLKYVVLLADGMADESCEELNGKTPLEVANTPHMDWLACKGEIGTAYTIPEGFPPGSDVANLSVMGYSPKIFYTGRSPLEAVSMGIHLDDKDTAFRCNLVTLSGEEDYKEKKMLDYCAGEISSEESAQLIAQINASFASENVRFYPGVSYRHLMVWPSGAEDTSLTPPHDISGEKIASYLPEGEGSETLYNLMKNSYSMLKDEPVNIARIEKGTNPANSIWLWGQGKKPGLDGFTEKYGLKGAVISAVDLIKGIGICAGMEVLDVPGATGNIHTNFVGKAETALRSLESGLDYVYIHIEAPDEASHQGCLKTKIKSIEKIDEILGQILQGLKIHEEFKIMVLPDHPTPMRTRTHSSDPVPFVIYDSRTEKRENRTFSEDTAAEAPLVIAEGHKLMDYFLTK